MAADLHIHNELIIKTTAEHAVSCGKEGIVVRPVDRFLDRLFAKSVFKYVRENHVQTDDHWMSKPVVPNELKK